jgi:hypothetical protein
VSRNLGQTDCRFCGGRVVLQEEPRPVTRAEVGVYFAEYHGMTVANAACELCEAQYLAWVNAPWQRLPKAFPWETHPPTHVDLSFRSTFDDEPGPADMPKHVVKPTRVGPWPTCERCGGPLEYVGADDSCFNRKCCAKVKP